MLNVEPCNLVFLKTYNTEFDNIIITIMDQDDRPLETEGKVNLILLINKNSTIFYMTRTRKYVKGYGFLQIARKCKHQLLDTGLDTVKNASKKVVHKAGEFFRK